MDMYIPLLRALWEIKYVFLFFFLLYLLPRVILIYRRHKEDKRLKECGIEEIDRFSGETFERYLRVIFQSKGYTVKMTKKSHDYGADLIISKNGETIAVQAKRYRNKVGIKAIQEAVASMKVYSCNRTMVITNSYYTKSALELARANQVELWNRTRLIQELSTLKRNGGKGR